MVPSGFPGRLGIRIVPQVITGVVGNQRSARLRLPERPHGTGHDPNTQRDRQPAQIRAGDYGTNGRDTAHHAQEERPHGIEECECAWVGITLMFSRAPKVSIDTGAFQRRGLHNHQACPLGDRSVTPTLAAWPSTSCLADESIPINEARVCLSR
jgi:hypothetical protein